MEQLIYIEQNDKIEASKMAKGFTVEDTRVRAYVNALGTELATKYLAQAGINITNIHNMHSINKIRETFDIADIMLPNIHIDVRVVYDENLIFIPKTHFDYNLTPDIYLVFKMAEETTHVSFLGFFEPKLINKNNSNDGYYFIEKEKLSHPSDLKSYIEFFNGNTTESLSENELENAQRLAIALIDDDITETDKKSLLSMLKRSSTLRENLIEFDNFEWISYHTANNQDFENIELDESSEEISLEATPVLDEFDAFESSDEFEEFNKTAEEPLDTDIVAETLHSIDYIQSGHTLEEDNITLDIDNLDDLDDSDTVENLDTLDEIEDNELSLDIENLPEKDTEEIINEDIFNNINNISEDEETNETYDTTDEVIENIETSDEAIEAITVDLQPEENLEAIVELTEETLEPVEDVTVLEDVAEDINETSEVIEDVLFTEQTENEENIDNLALETEFEFKNSELITLPEENTEDVPFLEENFDDTGIQTEEDLELFDEMLLNNEYEDAFEDNSTAEETLEPVSLEDLPEVEEQPTSTVDTETADIIDALLSDNILETLPGGMELAEDNGNNDKDEDTVLENFENIEQVPVSEYTEETTETINFNNLEQSDEYSTNGMVEEKSTTISFDSLAEGYTSNDELAESFDQSLVVESIDSLQAESDIENDNSDDTDFLNSLVTEEAPSDNENQEIPTVFENSVIITNENIVPGEIAIDINEPISEEMSEDEMKKLEVLYNQNNGTFKFDNNSSGKGFKTLKAIGIIFAIAAVLITLGFTKKTNDKTTENTNTNVITKNIPNLLDKTTPETPEQSSAITPKPTPSKALTPVDPSGFDKPITPKMTEKEKADLDKAVKEAKAELAKPKGKPIERPYLDVQKLTWSVPDYLSYNEQFKRYLQTAGKSLKLSLSSDLLLATEYAYSNQITVDVTLTKEGTLKDTKIGQSSGSSEIDAIVLRTVKETLNVVKAPAGLIVGPSANLTLKIYL